MATKQVTCPSGLTGTLRGWKLEQVKAILDSPIGKGATNAFNRVLKAVFEPDHLGPYEAPLDWNNALLGDRAYLLIQSRMLSFSGDYSVRLQCPNPACKDENKRRTRFMWDIDLTELPVQPYSAESLATFKRDNRFTVEEAGRVYTFRLLVGADDVPTGPNPDLTEIIARRIVSVSDIGENRKKILAHLNGLEIADLVSLLRKFDTFDGGVDTEIEAQCDECGGVFDLNLPFERAFFLPDIRKLRLRMEVDGEETTLTTIAEATMTTDSTEAQTTSLKRPSDPPT